MTELEKLEKSLEVSVDDFAVNFGAAVDSEFKDREACKRAIDASIRNNDLRQQISKLRAFQLTETRLRA